MLRCPPTPRRTRLPAVPAVSLCYCYCYEPLWAWLLCCWAAPRMRLLGIRMRLIEEENYLTFLPLVYFLLVFLLISTVFAGDTDATDVMVVKIGS